MQVEEPQENYGEEGYIKLFRNIIDNSVFCNPDLLKLWIWCLCKARHKEKSKFIPLKINSGYTEVEIKKGQFLFGRKKAGKKLGYKPSKIYSLIKKLEKKGKIESLSTKNYTIITVLNYHDYQSFIKTNQQPTNNQPTTNQQPKTHTIMYKNVKEEYIAQKKLSKGQAYEEAYCKFVDYLLVENESGKPANKILALSEQVSYEQYVKLRTKADRIGVSIKGKIDSMIEKPTLLKGRVSLYLTLSKWLDN